MPFDLYRSGLGEGLYSESPFAWEEEFTLRQ